ncbi:hypothetical protein J8273_2624 [Carpediemonas membranifera]|uniref:Uncharacterized protein n=1 Tax=Carpediemonas membranifera TaxID=201153 RepID=A0A8J6B9S1_9EUKA|nr:hypothetical protein J8273_2624 [Carpediemonas membranifera]|eukprot:KAG9395717.1 hypothetical protein J8273_2624 [Carpediemonas membranifera]
MLATGKQTEPTILSLSDELLWAIFLEGDANPDLEPNDLIERDEEEARHSDDEDEEEEEEEREEYEEHVFGLFGKADFAYPEFAKAHWFLSKKTKAALDHSEIDGDVTGQYPIRIRFYGGRFFAKGQNDSFQTGFLLGGNADVEYIARYRHARVPHIMKYVSDGDRTLAATVDGVIVWGESHNGSLGVGEYDGVLPSAVDFVKAGDVAEYEASLPAWHKHELVTKLFLGSPCESFYFSMIVTPAGTVAAGGNDCGFLGVGSTDNADDYDEFVPVELPTGFVPDDITADDTDSRCFLMTTDRRLAVSGFNEVTGNLGVGSDENVPLFTELPFPVDAIWPCSYGKNTFYLSGKTLFGAGDTTLIKPFLEDDAPDNLLTATPLTCSHEWTSVAIADNSSIICFMGPDKTSGAILVDTEAYDKRGEHIQAGQSWSLDLPVTEVRKSGVNIWLKSNNGWYVLGSNDCHSIEGQPEFISSPAKCPSEPESPAFKNSHVCQTAIAQ